MDQSKDFKKCKIPRSPESDIYNIIMKSSQGYDKIPPKIQKLCANGIAMPLSNIVNISTKLGTFVDTAKILWCTPHYKNQMEAGNKFLYIDH